MPVSLVHGANYALTEAINIKKSLEHIPALTQKQNEEKYCGIDLIHCVTCH